MAGLVDRVRALEKAVIHGDLDSAREAATWLAAHAAPATLPAGTQPLADRVTKAASVLTRAPDTTGTVTATADLVASCGSCHETAHVTPAFPRTGHRCVAALSGTWCATRTPPIDARRPRRAIGGGVDQGADQLGQAPLKAGDFPVSVPIGALMSDIETRIHAQADEAAAATDTPGRTQTYGALLARCAECHTRHTTLSGSTRRPMTKRVVPLFVSALGGAAVGVERQWSGHAEGENARFAGLRTFTLLGLLGGLAGQQWTSGGQWLAALLVGGAAALVVVAYAAASRRDVDGTTEVAALVVLAAGVLAGSGEVQLASGVIALTVLLLVEKSRLHALVQLLDDRGFRAGARFAVLALVVLPLLPEGPSAPWAAFALAPSGRSFSFLGLELLRYIARTVVGDRYGYAVAGLLGGLVSSTSVTLTYARLSREVGTDGRRLASGALAACSVLLVRVALAVAVLNAALLPDLVPLLVAPLAVGLVAVWFSVRGGASGGPPPEAPSNPLQLIPALQMAAAFQVVLFLLDVVNRRFGNAGLMASAFALGLTDVDALTASMTSASPADCGRGGRCRYRRRHPVELAHQTRGRAGHRSRALPSGDSHRPGGDDAGGSDGSHRRHLRRISGTSRAARRPVIRPIRMRNTTGVRGSCAASGIEAGSHHTGCF